MGGVLQRSRIGMLALAVRSLGSSAAWVHGQGSSMRAADGMGGGVEEGTRVNTCALVGRRAGARGRGVRPALETREEEGDAALADGALSSLTEVRAP